MRAPEGNGCIKSKDVPGAFARYECWALYNGPGYLRWTVGRNLFGELERFVGYIRKVVVMDQSPNAEIYGSAYIPGGPKDRGISYLSSLVDNHLT
jgi:hypothetical protein